MIEESKNRLALRCLGGCGTNIGEDIINGINVTGIAKLPKDSVDASPDLMLKELSGNIIRIEPKTKSAEIVGSGGERSMNIEHIKESTIEYANQLKFDPRTINVVVTSASGGSGAPISAVLVDELVRRKHNVLVVLVTDYSNEQYIKNSIATIKTLGAISKKHDKNIVVNLFNNNGENKLTAERNVNNNITLSLTYLAMLFSGNNIDMDTQDIGNMFNTSNYKDLRVPAGLMMLKWETGGVEDSSKYALTRTIVSEQFNKELKLGHSLHDKVGRVSKDIEPFFNKLLPQGDLTLALEYNVLKRMLDDLNEAYVKVTAVEFKVDEVDTDIDEGLI